MIQFLIRVVDGVVVRRFDSALTPVASERVRRSRYGREPVI